MGRRKTDRLKGRLFLIAFAFNLLSAGFLCYYSSRMFGLVVELESLVKALNRYRAERSLEPQL